VSATAKSIGIKNIKTGARRMLRPKPEKKVTNPMMKLKIPIQRMSIKLPAFVVEI
jgi:hypothetical protein